MWSKEYDDCLNYIDSYWDKIIHKKNYSSKFIRLFVDLFKNKDLNFIVLPFSHLSPNDSKFKYTYYWDTFFMFQGLIGTKHEWIMEEMLKNFFFLFKNFSLIPNYNSPASLNRSQPPFLTSMILDVYKIKLKRGGESYSKKWLKGAIKIAKNEYQDVWIDKKGLFNHSVENIPLSRYGDRDIGYAHSSELESGWDFTSRFYNSCNEYLPIDLNSYLYKYETDFALFYEILGNVPGSENWRKIAETRKEIMNRLMWDEKKGFFFDFNWHKSTKSEFVSLAGFTPLWTGLATPKQAKQMIQMLPSFETKYGLTITDRNSLAHNLEGVSKTTPYADAINRVLNPKQWDYPNIWPPLEYLTVIGLMKYGFIDKAKNIMSNSVKAHADLYRTYKTFFEKINAETGKPGKNFEYLNQKGFGWTNAVFYNYIIQLDTFDSEIPNEKLRYEI